MRLVEGRGVNRYMEVDVCVGGRGRRWAGGGGGIEGGRQQEHVRGWY